MGRGLCQSNRALGFDATPLVSGSSHEPCNSSGLGSAMAATASHCSWQVIFFFPLLAMSGYHAGIFPCGVPGLSLFPADSGVSV